MGGSKRIDEGLAHVTERQEANGWRANSDQAGS
jgi:hypothetical protein